ncbi:MAG TPA: DNA primase [Terriglobia bacterium]|nr:DNA primase [Terriglobia bacterium]
MKPAEEIRNALDIVKLVGESVKLRKSGANFVGLCPFHQEKTPSFAVHPTKQIFHCFGCGVGGDIFKFVMLLDNITFPEAVERLAEKANITLPDRWSQGHDDAAAKERAALQKMHEVAAQFYAAQLGSSVEGRAARGYLEDRGLSGAAIADFRLGYAPSAGAVLAQHLSEAGFAPESMETAGLVIAGRDGRRPFDRFRRRIIFPIANESGKVVAFAGRTLGGEEPKYLNSPETPIYTKSRLLYHLHRAASEIRKQDGAILVEGYMDCIALASSGVIPVVASCGTSLTVSQIRLLGRSTRRVVVNFDPDSAGVAATERSLGFFLEEGFEVKVLSLPGGLDPDSFIRKQGVAAYKELLVKAPSYLDYLTERAIAAQDVSTPEGKVRAANAVLPHLVKVSNAMLRDEMAARLGERLRLDQRLFREELKRMTRGSAREIQIQPEAATAEASPAEKELLRAFLADAELAAEFLGPLLADGIDEGLPTAGLFRKIMAEYTAQGNLDMSRLEGVLSPEEQRCVLELQFAPGELPDRQRVISSAKALKKRKLEQQRAALQREIEQAQRSSDTETFNHLWEAKLQITRELAQLRKPETPESSPD